MTETSCDINLPVSVTDESIFSLRLSLTLYRVLDSNSVESGFRQKTLKGEKVSGDE